MTKSKKIQIDKDFVLDLNFISGISIAFMFVVVVVLVTGVFVGLGHENFVYAAICMVAMLLLAISRIIFDIMIFMATRVLILDSSIAPELKCVSIQLVKLLKSFKFKEKRRILEYVRRHLNKE